ncbi:hypothetical protein JTB14_016925 [Gonioctena quinquepunctata]|nr:hypothetical protein JTB14_016925 [Gonioctena quinquepunctata]
MSRFNYDDEYMEKAIEAVKKGSPIATAARMALSVKFKGKTPMQRKMGPPSSLSEIEEQNLVRWICHLGDLDKNAPRNLKPNEPNISPNSQPILCPVSYENSTEISSELSVDSITIQHYEAATEQAPSNITQKDNLLDISITGTDEPTLPTTEIEVLDTVIEEDQFLPSTA